MITSTDLLSIVVLKGDDEKKLLQHRVQMHQRALANLLSAFVTAARSVYGLKKLYYWDMDKITIETGNETGQYIDFITSLQASISLADYLVAAIILPGDDYAEFKHEGDGKTTDAPQYVQKDQLELDTLCVVMINIFRLLTTYVKQMQSESVEANPNDETEHFINKIVDLGSYEKGFYLKLGTATLEHFCN